MFFYVKPPEEINIFLTSPVHGHKQNIVQWSGI